MADECVRSVNAADGSFRSLLRGALVTGARYGELGRMRVEDFNAAAGVVTVRRSKGAKIRHIALNDEGQRLFAELTAGRSSRDLVFPRVEARRGAHRTSSDRSLKLPRLPGSIRQRPSTSCGTRMRLPWQ